MVTAAASYFSDSAVNDTVFRSEGGNILLGQNGSTTSTVSINNTKLAVGIRTPGAPSITTSFVGGGLPAANYSYAIVAVDAATGTTVAGPSANCDLTVSGDDACNLTWTAVPGAASYRVYRNNSVYITTTANSLNDEDQWTTTGGSAPTSNTSNTSRLSVSNESWIGGSKVYISTGGSMDWHTSNASLYVSEYAQSGRSINAAGSVNVDGNDFAEWIPWEGVKPDQGSIVSYKGSSFVVSSMKTAAFVGNDNNLDETNAILVTFAGQVPVKVTGAVTEGDLLVPAGNGLAKAVNPAQASLGEILSQIGIAQENSSDAAIKLIKATIGGTSSNLANPQHQTLDSLNVTGSANLGSLNVSGPTTLANLRVTGDAEIEGKLTVAAIEVGNITVNGHIITAGDAPTSEALTAIGTDATVVINGNDTAGTVTITTGAEGISAGDMAKISFSKAFGKTPKIILSGQDQQSEEATIFPGSKTVNDFMLKTSQVLTPNTTYTFDYFVVE